MYPHFSLFKADKTFLLFYHQSPEDHKHIKLFKIALFFDKAILLYKDTS